ncbi:phosphatase PAP2 family protein [Neptunicella marina]|uniref:undecaprenyl-diphosphate phosphatase n=1 Tax=Neptunicella marina TaxID=2125989 RepID=A0A8J6IZ68_9ALTE|nr:phosphatase PAP2 family protein [Neptunicella marina]MBC3767546.1 phosphatase PAP2 family protein [Neptunicella marina]
MTARFPLPLILLVLYLFSQNSFAKSDTETYGDIGAVTLPLFAAGWSYLNNDQQGIEQFSKAALSNLALTQLLKYAVHKKRPQGNSYTSFPSMHSSVAFQSATYLQKRYGWKYGVPAYTLASYVGWSRVKSNQHYSIDVLAGAAIGILSSAYFTERYKDLNIAPYANADGVGVHLAMNF